MQGRKGSRTGDGELGGRVLIEQRENESLSHVWLFATPWSIQSMEFSRPECWSGQPFPSPVDLPNPGIEPRSPSLQVNYLPAEPQGKPKNTGVGSLSLLQGIFTTQVSGNEGGFFTNWTTSGSLGFLKGDLHIWKMLALPGPEGGIAQQEGIAPAVLLRKPRWKELEWKENERGG